MARLTKEQKQEIVKLYKEGVSPTIIAKEYGLYNNGSVIRIIRKMNIDRNVKKVEYVSVQYMIEQYNKGISSEIIAKNLNIAGSTVVRALKKAGVKIRPSEENKRKYKINENYFENIDCESKAYWLGFLYADGSPSQPTKGKSIKLTLHQQDVDALEKFSNEVYGFRNIHSDREYMTVYVYSKKMHSDLVKLGCTNNKTFTIKFPEFLRQDLLRHFVRGYFDGDGCLSITNINKPVVGFTSNKNFIYGLIDYIESNTDIICNKLGQRHDDTDTRCIQILGFEKTVKILELMYKDATIYMNRKRNKYDEFLNIIKNRNIKNLSKLTDISNYGTYYIPTYNNALLTANNVQEMSETEKENVSKFLFEFYRENGFPYTKLTDNQIIKDFSILKNADPNSIEDNKNLSTYNNVCVPTFKHFSPHYFETNTMYKRLSMLDTFNDDELLLKIINNRLSYNLNMTGNMLKQGLANSKLAFKASIFLPIIAKFIYNKFSKDNDIIYDYSMGFGQRLLGALSLQHKIKYIGIDPYKKSYESNNNIYNFLNKSIPMLNKEAEFVNVGSEDYCDEKYIGKVNLAFSSPPYFNLEKYCDDNNQATVLDYNNFINSWWRKTVYNINKLLAEDGTFILNMKENVDGFYILEDMANVLKESGFKIIDRYDIRLTKNLVFANKNNIHKYEPILIFKR